MVPIFVLMKLRYTKKADIDSDTATYMLLGFIFLVVILGALKIIFF